MEGPKVRQLEILRQKCKPSQFQASIKRNLPLHRLSTIGDGNCFLHAVLGSTQDEYRIKAWTEDGKSRKNNSELSGMAELLRSDILSKFFFAEIVNDDFMEEYLKRIFGGSKKEIIFRLEEKDNLTNFERHITRIFQLPQLFNNFEEDEEGNIDYPLGYYGNVWEDEDGDFFYIKTVVDGENISIPLQNYNKGDIFDPLVHIDRRELIKIHKEFLAKPFESATNIYNLSYSRDAFVVDEEGGGTIFPAFSSLYYLTREGYLIDKLYNCNTKCQDIWDFFLQPCEYFTQAYIQIAAITLNINIIILDRSDTFDTKRPSSPTVIYGLSHDRPWIVMVLVGDGSSTHYETVGQNVGGRFKTVFAKEDLVISTLFGESNSEPPFDLKQTIIDLELDVDFPEESQRFLNYPESLLEIEEIKEELEEEIKEEIEELKEEIEELEEEIIIQEQELNDAIENLGLEVPDSSLEEKVSFYLSQVNIPEITYEYIYADLQNIGVIPKDQEYSMERAIEGFNKIADLLDLQHLIEKIEEEEDEEKISKKEVEMEEEESEEEEEEDLEDIPRLVQRAGICIRRIKRSKEN